MRSVWIYTDSQGSCVVAKPTKYTVRYVPASELAKVRSENRRLRKAVEWALEQKMMLIPKDRDKLTRRAGLRRDGKARKWVKK